MDKKNLRKRRELGNISKGLVVMGLLNFFGGCTPVNNRIIDPNEEPVKVGFETTSELYFHVFDRQREETELYIEEREYNQISKDKKRGDLAEIPYLRGFNVKAGQGRFSARLNNLGHEGYMNVFLDGKPYGRVYISERGLRDFCEKDSEEQSYDGRFVKIPGTQLEARCVRFDGAPNPIGGGNGGSDGGSGGAGGGGGSSGGGSAGGI